MIDTQLGRDTGAEIVDDDIRLAKYAPMPLRENLALRASKARVPSPPSGSTLTVSAPRSVMIMAA